jgi:hypothetical protein
MSRQPDVISHWHKVYENFATSPLDFYTMVEQEIIRWKIPEVEFSRVVWREGGILTGKRTYLRVTRGPINFDICAAPYGTGFFFSYWVTSPPKRLKVLLYLLGVCMLFLSMLGAGLYAFDGKDAGAGLGFLFAVATLFGLAFAVRSGKIGDEEAVFAIPILGRIYGTIFKPVTWFAIDTMTMFQEAVAHCLFEVIDTVTTPRGIRELSEFERRPMVPPGSLRKERPPLPFSGGT